MHKSTRPRTDSYEIMCLCKWYVQKISTFDTRTHRSESKDYSLDFWHSNHKVVIVSALSNFALLERVESESAKAQIQGENTIQPVRGFPGYGLGLLTRIDLAAVGPAIQATPSFNLSIEAELYLI